MERDRQLIHFLQRDLALSEAAIAIALKHSEATTGPLPMILWQYGLVSLEQLSRIFDWLGDQTPTPTHPLFELS